MHVRSRARWLSGFLMLIAVNWPGAPCLAQPGQPHADLFDAIHNRDVSQVLALLTANADPNARDSRGETALQAAVAQGSTALVDLLLDKGADVNATSRGLRTALMFAAAGGRVIKTDSGGERDYESGGILDLVTPAGKHLAYTSAKERATTETDAAVLKALLSHGARVDTSTTDGRTALWFAVWTHNRAGVRLLLKEHSNPNIEGDQAGSPLRMAIQGKDQAIVRLLLAHYADPNLSDDGETPLATAIREHQLEIADLVLRSGAKIDKRSGNDTSPAAPAPPLIRAIQAKYSAGAQFLLGHHADVNAMDTAGGTALLYAIRNNDIALVKTLLDRNVPLNGLVTQERGNGAQLPLNYLMNTANPAMLELLLARGARIHTIGPQGEDVLFATARNGNPKCLQVLLQHGADPNSRNWHGMTALMIAAEFGSIDNIRLLLGSGADVNAQEASQTTALTWAIARPGNKEILELLLANGARLDTPDRFGHTPLISAVLQGNEENVRCLLQHGADRTPKDSTGKTALMWAEELKAAGITSLLLAANPR